MSDNQEIHEVVDILGRVFQDTLAEELEESGVDYKLEPWIKGVPSARLSWMGSDTLGRNITGYLSEDTPSELQVEINAWSDSTGSDGEIREWYHEQIKVLKLNLDDPDESDWGEVEASLREAYSELSEITRRNLNSEASLETAGDIPQW
jgi:hypothetical protein